jgi:hypothetical protein
MFEDLIGKLFKKPERGARRRVSRQRQIHQRDLTTLARKARENALPDVTLTDRDLRIALLRNNTPESAEVFAENAAALMPHVKITEVLAKVDQWTNLGDQFLHLCTQAAPTAGRGTGEPARRQVLHPPIGSV